MLNKEIQLKNGLVCVLRQPQKDDAQRILDYMNIAITETDFLSFGKGELTWTLEEEHKFIKEHLDDKKRAIKLYKKYGFVKEGKISRQLLIDKKFYDAYLMGLEICP